MRRRICSARWLWNISRRELCERENRRMECLLEQRRGKWNGMEWRGGNGEERREWNGMERGEWNGMEWKGGNGDDLDNIDPFIDDLEDIDLLIE